MKHLNKIPTIDFVLHEINGKEFKNQLYDAFKKFSCFQLTNLYGVFDSRHNFKVMEEILQNKEFLSRNMANQNNPRGFYFYQGKGVDVEQPYKEDIVAFQLGRIDKSELELRKPYLQLINSGPQFLTHGKIDWVDRCDFKNKMEKIYADHTYVAEILLQNLSMVLDIDLISMHSKKDYTLEYKKYQGVTKLENTINALQQEYQNNNSTLGMTISDALDPSQELRLKPHKDLSTITLLSQTNIQEDYLQVLYEGNWISVNEIPDASTMIVSCGDVLELLTAENHKLKSCIHRVISQRDSSTNRFSSVLFCTPNYESEIKKAGEIVYFGDLVPF